MIQAVICVELLLSFSTVDSIRILTCQHSVSRAPNNVLEPHFNGLNHWTTYYNHQRQRETLVKLSFLTFPERIVYTSKSSCL